MRGLHQVAVGCFSIYRVDHHLSRGYLLDSIQPWLNISEAGVVNIFALVCRALHKHSLDDDMPMKILEMLYNLIDAVTRLLRTIYFTNISGAHRIELEYVIIHQHEGIMHLFAMNEG